MVGNEAQEVSGRSEVQGVCSEAENVFVRVGSILNKHSAKRGAQTRIVVWIFVLQVCFWAQHGLFSPLIPRRTFCSPSKIPSLQSVFVSLCGLVVAAEWQDVKRSYLSSHIWHSLCSQGTWSSFEEFYYSYLTLYHLTAHYFN